VFKKWETAKGKEITDKKTEEGKKEISGQVPFFGNPRGGKVFSGRCWWRKKQILQTGGGKQKELQ